MSPQCSRWAEWNWACQPSTVWIIVQPKPLTTENFWLTESREKIPQDKPKIFKSFLEPLPTALTCVNAAPHTNLSRRLKSHNTVKLWFIIVLAGVMAALLLSHCDRDTRCSGVVAVIFIYLFIYYLIHIHVFFSPSKTTITFRWTTSCCRMCVMRRQWPHWRTPPTWFTSRWPSLDRCISMTCMPLQTTQAVRIYRFLHF